MKQYRCHKVVEAAQIKKVRQNANGTGTILTVDGDQIEVTDKYMAKHAPQKDGYFVRYEDGYESWSPQEAFESGYSEIVDEDPVDG